MLLIHHSIYICRLHVYYMYTTACYMFLLVFSMKEQLIRQLVKNEKDSAVLVKQHKDKIAQMEEVRCTSSTDFSLVVFGCLYKHSYHQYIYI